MGSSMKPDVGQGLQAIYHAAREELRRFLVARIGDAAEAEDVLQELWVRIHQLPNGPIGNGRAYLFRAAQNLIVDRVRARDRRTRRERAWSEEQTACCAHGGEAVDGSKNAEEELLDREVAAMIASAVMNLPAGARRAFQLHKLEGLSHAEVAHRMGISKSGVEKHMAVAMKYLRRALFDWGRWVGLRQ